MPTLGTDCDVILTHPAVNGGQPYGFLLKPTDRRGLLTTVQREAYQTSVGSFNERLKLTLRLWIADNLNNPDGGLRAQTAEQDYAAYLAFVAVHTNITATLRNRTFTQLRSTLIHSYEFIGSQSDEIMFVLNNGGYQEFSVGGINFEAFNESLWLPDGGTSQWTWDTSYFR